MVKGGMTLPVAPATERLAGKMQSKIIAIPIVRFEQIYCLHPLASPDLGEASDRTTLQRD
jgi:hypothetical protein